MGRYLYLLYRIFLKIRDTSKTIMYRSLVVAGKGVKFFSSTKILNAQGDKSCIKIGDFTTLRGELFIFGHGGKIIIGNNCYIGELTKIWSSSEIVIGDNVLIAHNVNIHDNNSHPINSRERQEHYSKIYNSGHPKNIDLQEKPIKINNNAWIGFNAIILKGVTIGEGSIVAAGSVVTKDVPSYTIVAGNPAKIVKYLNKDE
jgi:acetyltransferase-like isoleucine patch superfamily enzyme